MADLDILVIRLAAGEAPKITEVPKWGTLEKPSLTMPFNVTGYPAMSVCTGFGAGGLPVAMQMIAKPFAEATLVPGRPRLRDGSGLAQAPPGNGAGKGSRVASRHCERSEAIG